MCEAESADVARRRLARFRRMAADVVTSDDGHARGRLSASTGQRSWLRAVVCGMLAALVVASAASAHGGGGSTVFVSDVTAITPTIPGFTAVVLGSDDIIQMENRSGRTVVVRGYAGEPYMMFSSRGVSVNVHSPAWYLNEDRYGRVTLPPAADAKLPPKWEIITLGRRWSWYDQRIHWMSTALPDVVKRDPGQTHLVFRWKIPIDVAGRGSAEIRGRLVYIPPKGGSNLGLIIGIALPSGLLVLAGVGTLLIVRRRRQREAAE